ncbi:hypothetical protein RB213_007145 [Colletotrichum asianum]
MSRVYLMRCEPSHGNRRAKAKRPPGRPPHTPAPPTNTSSGFPLQAACKPRACIAWRLAWLSGLDRPGGKRTMRTHAGPAAGLIYVQTNNKNNLNRNYQQTPPPSSSRRMR